MSQVIQVLSLARQGDALRVDALVRFVHSTHDPQCAREVDDYASTVVPVADLLDVGDTPEDVEAYLNAAPPWTVQWSPLYL